MSSGDDRSPDGVDSESDASDDHPVDAVIQQAISRQQSPLAGSQIDNSTGKRKREQAAANADVVSLLSSSPDSPSRKDVKHRRSSGPSSASNRAATAAPVGVTVVEEGTEGQNTEVRRLLRGSRYFDDNIEELGLACYNCGQRGHKAFQCQNPRKQTPCALCAQYGHNKADCPMLLCYKCKRRGHIARECPNPHLAMDSSSQICLRCGKADCDAAGREDYHRAEGGCTESYSRADLALVRCYICNRMGHLCCATGPQEAPQPSCHNCGDAGHRASDCNIAKPTQVTMERQQDGWKRHHSRMDADRGRPHSTGPYDRWSNGNSYGLYNDASMAGGSSYASRVNAFANNSHGGYNGYNTPEAMPFAPSRRGNRFYPGSEKIHGPQHDAYDAPYNGYDRRSSGPAPYSAPFDRWRR